jgi:hypothetical protein
MSGKLGITVPAVDHNALETDPLKKYHDQLNPLAQLTTKLFAPAVAPRAAPIDPMMARQMARPISGADAVPDGAAPGSLCHRGAMGSAMLAPLRPPWRARPPQVPPPCRASPPPAGTGSRRWRGPHDITQYARPGDGGWCAPRRCGTQRTASRDR